MFKTSILSQATEYNPLIAASKTIPEIEKDLRQIIVRNDFFLPVPKSKPAKENRHTGNPKVFNDFAWLSYGKPYS